MAANNALQRRPSRQSAAADEELVTLNYGRLYRWFLWLTDSPGDAADLTQDTFVAVWESLDRFDTARPLTPWLFGVARNVWRGHHAARRRREAGGADLLDTLPSSNQRIPMVDPLRDTPSSNQPLFRKVACRVLTLR